MPEKRHLPTDLFALALLAATACLFLALATYSPSDPTPELVFPFNQLYQHDPLVYPPPLHPHNWCGRWGALTADLLFSTFGVGAWFSAFSLGLMTLQVYRRQGLDMPLVRGGGWFVAQWGVATLAALLLPSWSPGPVVGAGGYLGALGRSLVELHFATAGGLILTGSLTLGGLLLSTDYTLFQALVWTLHWATRSREGAAPTATASAVTAAVAKKAKKDALRDAIRSDLDTSPTAGMPVRLKGKPVEPARIPAAELEDVPAGESDLELDDEPAEVAPPVKGKISAATPAAPVPLPADTKTRQDDPENPLRVRNTALKRREREGAVLHIDESNTGEVEEYRLPGVDLLMPSEDIDFEAQAAEVRRKAKILEKTFADFGFTVKVVEIETGPVIAQYEVELEAGLRLSKITGLADDLAIALRVPSVRIVAPIPGKNTVGIEVPNEQRQVVRLREVIEESSAKLKKMRIPLFLGKDVSGNAMVADLSTLPHLLIAGRTGTGKSVCLNAIITSILMTRRPDEVRMLMIDPKMVELSGYARLPHLMHPVVTDMRKAEAILAWAVDKMEERYALLARAGVRHISSFNQLGEEELMDRLQPETDEERESIPRQLPFIVIVADEMADLMMTAGKEVEQHIIRLAQKSRAVGIHLILATQKPTVDVITGLIKSNLPARIAFQVASRTDSRVVLDEMGADKLLGNGDMLFLWPGTSTLLRGQGTYLSDDEINQVCDFCSQGKQQFVQELVNMKVKDKEGEGAAPGQLKKRDELYEQAVDWVVREGRGSVSLLQRALGIGYGRAARLIDFMAEDNIVGQYNGSQAREILISIDEWEQMKAAGAEEEPPPKASGKGSKKRSNKVRPEPVAPPPPVVEYEEDEPAYEEPEEDYGSPVFAAQADDAEENETLAAGEPELEESNEDDDGDFRITRRKSG